MQILKEKVKEKIINASKELFETNGFVNTSMQDIAVKANISTGNIYRYFKTKQQLLDELLKEVEEKIEEVVKLIPEKRQDTDYNKVSDMLIENVIVWCEQNNKSLKVLLACKEQIQYIKFKLRMIDVLNKRISALQPSIKGKKADPILMGAITNSIFDGITYIVANTNNDIDKMKKLLHKFMKFSLINIDEKIMEVCING